MLGSLHDMLQHGWIWSVETVAVSHCKNIPELTFSFFIEITSMNSEQLTIDHPGRKDKWNQILFKGMLLNDGLIKRHSEFSYAQEGFGTDTMYSQQRKKDAPLP